MNRRLLFVVLLTVGMSAGGPGLAIAEEPAADCSLTGRVVDGEDGPVAGAAVILCRHEDGIPFLEGAERTLTDDFGTDPRPKEPAWVLTDDEGRFALQGLRPGAYRLVAQSWRDADTAEGLSEALGEQLELHGVAERVDVAADAPAEVVIRPLGTGILRMDEEAPNDATVLVLSTQPPRADPILGFVGWSGAFLRNAIGVNRMPRGRTTVTGLPEGTVHVVLFANDNNPGFGAAEVTIRAGVTTDLYVPLVASWSDARHDPPERLAALVEKLKAMDAEDETSVIELLKRHEIDPESLNGRQGYQTIIENLEKEITLPDGQEVVFGDLMAAARYVDLQRTMAERARRRQQRQRQAEEGRQ